MTVVLYIICNISDYTGYSFGVGSVLTGIKLDVENIVNKS